MLNKNLLLSKMALHGDNQGDLAVYIGLTLTRFSAKLNGVKGATFTPKEMVKIKIRYNLTNEEFLAIFFANDVS